MGNYRHHGISQEYGFVSSVSHSHETKGFHPDSPCGHGQGSYPLCALISPPLAEKYNCSTDLPAILNIAPSLVSLSLCFLTHTAYPVPKQDTNPAKLEAIFHPATLLRVFIQAEQVHPPQRRCP